MESVKLVGATGADDSFNGDYLAIRLASAEPEKAMRKAHQDALQVAIHRAALMPFEALKAAL